MKKGTILWGTVSLACVMLLATFLPAAAQAQSASSKPTSSSPCGVNVTSILNDSDSQVPSVAFQFQSDGLGPYTAYSKPNHDSVTSMIDKNCAWSLDTTGSKSRGIAVTLAYNYSSPSQPPPFTSATIVKGRANTHCDTNNAVQPGAMTFAGQASVCPINVAFYAPNGVWYNIGINPFNWTGTTMAQVTCTGASGGHCNSWTILPDPATSFVDPSTNQLSSIGELTLPPCVGCGGGTALGLYYFSYSFLIHK